MRVLETDLEVLMALAALPGRGYWTATQLAAQLGRPRGDVVASLYALRVPKLALSDQSRGREAVWRPTELGAPCRGEGVPVRLSGIDRGDLLLVSKGGRHVYGEVVEVRQGVVQFRPLCRGVSWRHAGAREIVAHWRRAAGSAGPDDAYSPPPPSQLSFAGKLES